MRQISGFKYSCLVASLIMTASFTAGCRTEEKETIRLGEWIRLLDDRAGIVLSESSTPYYVNIPKGSEYYNDVQAAVEWEVIDPSAPFDPEAELTKEWTAYTLMNLSGRKQGRTDTVRDLSDSVFPEQVSAAVSSGLMQVDGRGKFHPKDVISRHDAESLLDQIIVFINSPDITSSAETIELKEDSNVRRVAPLSYDEITRTAWFDSSTDVKEGDLIGWRDPQGYENLYVVDELSVNESGSEARLSVPSYEKITDHSEIWGNEEIDFSKAGIYTEEGNEISSGNAEHHHLSALHPVIRSFQINEYQITLTAAGSSLKAEAKKKLPSGTMLYAETAVSGVKTDYRWEYDVNHIRNGFFKVTFDSYEHAGMKKSIEENRFADFSQIRPDQFIASLKNVLKKQTDEVQEAFTLCTIRVPVGTTGAVSLKMKLQLNLYASGQAELMLTQENMIGCEIRNHALRIIKDQKRESEGSVSADLKPSAGIYFGLCLAQMTLMDAELDIGADTKVETTFHIYDEDGSHRTIKEKVPMDAAAEAAGANPDVLVCGDLKAEWIAEADVNSSSSAAGRLGLSGSFSLLDAEGNALIPGLNAHIENFRIVKKCTRTDRPKLKKSSPVSSEHLSISRYSLIIPGGQSDQIEILTMPEGYEISDLRFSSADPSVAEVDGDGKIIARNPGSTTITVATEDNQFKARCSVLVPKVGS